MNHDCSLVLRRLVLVWVCVAAPAAFAGQWAGFLAAGTDNVYRGLSQGRGDASWNGDIHWRSDGGWFAGLGLATVNLNSGPGAPLELAGYVGGSVTVAANFHGSLTVLHYEYPHDSRQLSYAYDEAIATIGYSDRIAMSVSYSPDTSRFSYRSIAKHRPAYSGELSAAVPLGRGWRANVGVGRYVISQPIDGGYNYWNVGADFAHGPWQFVISAIGTDRSAKTLFGATITKTRCVATVIWRFRGSNR